MSAEKRLHAVERKQSQAQYILSGLQHKHMRSEKRQSVMEQTIRNLIVEQQRTFEAALSAQELAIAKIKKEYAALLFRLFLISLIFLIFLSCLYVFLFYVLIYNLIMS